MIGIIDYDAGNIKSVEKALAYIGEETIVSRDPEVLLKADKAILPGVGSFGQAMENLHRYNLVPVIKDMVKNNTPFLGICLGLQLLFESSEETPGVEGLGILKGKILRIPPAEGLKIPHMGWNSLHLQNNGRLFQGIPEDTYVYFVHSYYLHAEEPEIVKAATEYSTTIHASVEKGQCICMPVPSGEEQQIRPQDPGKFCETGKGGELICLPRESFPVWMSIKAGW